jgi:hypothetical protein
MKMNTPQLPLSRSLSLAYWLSLAVGILLAVVSLAGILFQNTLYPSEDLARAFFLNDVVNLLIGLPILLGSMMLTRRGKLVGLLFWPGALLYTLYNYIAYAVAMPQSLQFSAYLALVVLCIASIFVLVSSMDAVAIQNLLKGAVPEKFGGGVLVGLGVLFFFMRAGIIVQALSGAGQDQAEAAVAIADLFIMPALVIGGILLWQRKPLGYVSGAGLLFQASMLFVGLLAIFILQPFLTNTPFPLVDFGVVFIMSLICFIPFGLFLRGIVKKSPERESSISNDPI